MILRPCPNRTPCLRPELWPSDRNRRRVKREPEGQPVRHMGSALDLPDPAGRVVYRAPGPFLVVR
jgi:hypothetical protein